MPDNAPASRPPEVEEAIAELKICMDAEDEQRGLEEDDLLFDAGDQWPDEIKLSRGRQVIDNVEIPARPMLTIPKLDQPVQLVVNQMRRSHLGTHVHANSEDADRNTAQVLEDLMRHIQTKSNSELARNWAFERAVRCGRGYYRVLARYCDDYGTQSHWSDQELVIQRILNQGAVYLDPYATEPDWSDGLWAQIGGFLPQEVYKRNWPNSKMADLISQGDEFDLDEALVPPDWMTPDMSGKQDQKRGIRVMERFVVTVKNRTRVAYASEDGSQMQDEYLTGTPKEQAQYLQNLGDRLRAKRETAERQVKWMKLNCLEVLEQEDWPGKWIPIFPVIAREQYFDNTRRWVGMIRPAKDGARLFNYAATAAVEKEALDTKSPYIGYEGQFKGHESAWAQSATRAFPYLQVAPVTIGGQPAPLPQRNTASPNLAGSLALLGAADEFLKATTGTYDPSLGNASSSGESGRKILALQQQSDQANSHFLDNLATVTMPHEARVLLDLIPKYYDRPGRIALVMGDTAKEPREVMLNQPYVTGPNGAPQAVPKEMMDQGIEPQGMKHYDLAKGSYSAVVSVGKNYESRLREGSDEIGKLIEGAPDLLKIIGDIYFTYRDFPGHQQIADRMKKMLPPGIADDNAEETLEGAKAKLAQIQQEFEKLKQAFQEASQALETKQVETQGKVQIEQSKIQGQMALEQMKLEAEVKLAQVDASIKVQIAELEAMMDARTTMTKVAAEHQSKTALQDDQQAHELGLEYMKHAMTTELEAAAHQANMETLGITQSHEAAMTAVAGQTERETGDPEREHESRENAQDRGHEAYMAEREMAHDAETGDTEREHEAREADKDRKAQTTEEE